MYKSFTASDHRKDFKLPLDYYVSGFLSYGAWDEKKYIEKLYSALDKLKVVYTAKKLEGFLSNIYEIKIANKVYWFSVLYGGAMLSEYIHFACLFGSNINIHLGSCGGLYNKMNALDLLIPSCSYGDDSITRAYQDEIKDHKHYSDKKLSNLLIEKISINTKAWHGPVVNCQAMMGETYEDIVAWSNDGYYGVEMETATVFSVSRHFKVKSAALLYVADNLIKGETVNSEEFLNQGELRNKLENYIYSIGLSALLNNK